MTLIGKAEQGRWMEGQKTWVDEKWAGHSMWCC